MDYLRGIFRNLRKESGHRLWLWWRIVPIGSSIAMIMLWSLNSHCASKTGPDGSKPATAAALFARYCQRCHDKDGKGSRYEGAPDFTSGSWQSKRNDIRLRVSILNGRGTDMPAFRDRLDDRQVKALVAHIRAFSPKRAGTGKNVKTAGSSTDEEDSFEKLKKEFETLKKQLQECTDTEGKKTASEKAAGKGNKMEAVAKVTPSSAALYQKLCQRCHGADGKGTATEGTPDFTSRTWHSKHSDAQLMVSILDGSNEMPSFRKNLSAARARDLAVHVRTFQAKRRDESE